MTSGKRMLLILCGAFGVLVALLVVVGTSVVWSLTSSGSGSAVGGVAMAGGAGLVGLFAAIVWRSRVVERSVTMAQLRVTTVMALALAEAGTLLGLAWALASQTIAGLWVGAGIFVVSLVVVWSGVLAADVSS